jgi:hypothetical protein
MGHHSEHTDLDTPSHPLNTQNIQTLTPRKRSHSLNAQNSLDTQMKVLMLEVVELQKELQAVELQKQLQAV